MTLPEIAGYRIFNQQLADSQIKSAVEMVEWFGAMQGQEYTQTKWALGLRLPNLNDIDIESELNEGRILRTHMLRPTWHFVSAKDIHWMLRLTAPRVHAANAHMYRLSELDRIIFNRCSDILVRILEGGKHLSRRDINNEFKRYRIIAEGFRLGYILMNAELEGIICSGAKQGNQFTYALLDERVKHKKSLENDEALAELAKRYFKSRSPATITDMATWSGLTVKDCRKGIEAIKKQLHIEVIEQQEYFFNPEVAGHRELPVKMYLLPKYDEFLMGYKDRSAIMTLKNGFSLKYGSMMVFHGQVIGTWRRTIKKKEVQIQYDFFRPPDKEQTIAFKDILTRFSEFLKMKIKV